MRPFSYARASDGMGPGAATQAGPVDAPVQYLAGGTTLMDLMKLDVLRPERLIDLSPFRVIHSDIHADGDGLTLGAFATMAAAARHPVIVQDYPVIAQSLQLAASAQIRNMATLGGNVLQRTRCAYFRDVAWARCNKRVPGSGCDALEGINRNHAVLGVDDSCIAQYPGDFGVALIALDASVTLSGPDGERRIPFATLHRAAEGQPHLETTLRPGEIITTFHIPAGAWTRRSRYLKVRDRQSYEFAIASAAVALDLEGGIVRSARIGLGGLAYRPWRASEAEAVLSGKPLTEETAMQAASAVLAGAITHGHNNFKPELGRRTIIRALLEARR
jgi:xanthine dehydrogenase YagS FAD-binding subunit